MKRFHVCHNKENEAFDTYKEAKTYALEMGFTEENCSITEEFPGAIPSSLPAIYTGWSK